MAEIVLPRSGRILQTEPDPVDPASLQTQPIPPSPVDMLDALARAPLPGVPAPVRAATGAAAVALDDEPAEPAAAPQPIQPAPGAAPAGAPAPVDPGVGAPPVPTATRTTSSGSRSESRVVPTAETPKIQADQRALDEKAAKQIKEETEARVRRAKIEEANSNVEAAIKAAQATEKQIEVAKVEEEVGRRKLIAEQEDATYKRMLADFNNPKNGFWARADTVDKFAGAFALITGVFGGAKDGSNVGADRIMAAVERDIAARRQQLEDQLGILNRSRADVTAAKNEISRRLEILDVKHASALEAAKAEGVRRLKKLGASEEEIAGNAGLLKIEQAAIDKRTEFDQKLWSKVQTDRAWQKVTDTGGAAAGGRGAVATREQAAADLNTLESNIKDALANPVSNADAAKYQDNKTRFEAAAASGQKGTWEALKTVGGRAVGVIPRSPFEGLDEKARVGIRARENLRAAQQRILTGLAAPVQEMNDIMMRYGIDPTDSPDAQAGKLRMFAQEIRNRAVQAGPAAPLYIQKADQLERMIGGGSAGGAPAAAPAGLPPGAVPGTYKGQRGYLLGNKFYPL